MRPINTSEELEAAINELESRKGSELFLLKEQFHQTREDFKLVNIIKGSFKHAIASPDLKTDAMNAAIGFTTGVIAKKLMIGKTINPFKKLLGIIVEMAVANKVAKNADGIKSAGSAVFSLFKRKEVQEKS